MSLPPEFDDTRREAKVSIYTTGVIGVSSIKDQKNRDIVAESLPKFLQHWILVFEFEKDRTIAAIEAINEDNRLVPYYYKQREKSWILEEVLGYTLISPKKIRALAEQNIYNDKYYTLIFRQTCHDWINEVIKELIIYKEKKTGNRNKNASSNITISDVIDGLLVAGSAIVTIAAIFIARR